MKIPTFTCCFALLALLGSPSPLVAAALPGPSVRASRNDGTRGISRYDVDLIVPIPVQFLGGMLIGTGRLGAEPSSKTSSAGWGATYLHHPKEGAPRFSVAMARFEDLSPVAYEPMLEIMVSSKLDGDDSPWPLRPQPTDFSESVFTVEYRRFPGFENWHVVLGHRIHTLSGWIFEAYIPDHVTAGWQTEGGATRFYVESRRRHRAFPITIGHAEGWTTGVVITHLVGFRQVVQEPFYFGIEVGTQKHALEFFDGEGKRQSTYEQDVTPWMEVSLQTWFSAL